MTATESLAHLKENAAMVHPMLRLEPCMYGIQLCIAHGAKIGQDLHILAGKE